MSYFVYYSDRNKPAIEVTGTNRTVTSLALVGRNSSGYAEDIATNFLHLLENHANSTPPLNPTEGQLWFDKSLVSRGILKINDGAQWTPVNGVYQQGTGPSSAVAKIGDIWVDTLSNQLNIFNGNSWTLVGPAFNNSTKTGIFPLTILDDQGEQVKEHNVIATYINGNIISIVSDETFTPNPTILGFSTIVPGLNVGTQSFNGTTAKLSGLANTALNLKLTGLIDPVSADNFLRNDTAGTINGFLKIASEGGIRIGAVNQTVFLERQGSNAALINRSNAGSIIFTIWKDNTSNEILTLNGNTKRIGVNNSSPTAELDVTGSGKFSGSLTINSTTPVALSVSGGVRVYNTLTVNGPLFASTSSFGGTITVGSLTQNGTAIEPIQSRNWDIGTIEKPFRTVYADNFSTTATSFSMVSTGMVIPWTGVNAPDGYFFCDGRILNVSTQTVYRRLFSVIGNTFGGTNETDFRVPALLPMASNIKYIIKY
jgi:hypothetical protein